jgi:hypothetical protein
MVATWLLIRGRLYQRGIAMFGFPGSFDAAWSQ